MLRSAGLARPCPPPSRPASQPPHTQRAGRRLGALGRGNDDTPRGQQQQPQGIPLAVAAVPPLPLPPPQAVLAESERRRLNSDDDGLFYALPRLGVQHADEGWHRRLQDLYAQRLQPGWHVLDLCSAANSHLPPALPLSVQGLGMSAAELAANPRLDSHWVQDLNRQPRLSSLRDSSLDAVLCACGVQYLQQPEAVFLEVRRVLRPGGLFIISFSSHCWEEKAIAGWLARPSLAARAQLVQQALAAAGFPPSEAALWEPEAAGQEGGSSCDPFAAVLASRLAAEQEQAEELTPPALRHMEAAADGGGVSAAVLECWVFAYRQMAADARELGVPASAIPPLPPSPSAADLQGARDRLSGLLASFLSAGL